MKKTVCDGSPPDRKVNWTIKTKDGRTLTGFGQTAFVAAASVGLLFEEIEDMAPETDDA